MEGMVLTIVVVVCSLFVIVGGFVEVIGLAPKNHQVYFGVTVPRCGKSVCYSSDTCFCDRECILFGDCCFDWHLNITNKNYTFSSNNTQPWYNIKSLSINTNKQYFMDNSHCVEIENGSSVLSVWAIDSCTSTSSKNTEQNFKWKTQCENPQNKLDKIPVTLRQSVGLQIVFRNKYCSYCHGWSDSDIIHWRAAALCSEADKPFLKSNAAIQDYIANYCKIIFFSPPNTGSIRKCFKGKKSKNIYFTSNINDTLAILCSSYVTPVKTFSGSQYTNPHCGEYNSPKINAAYNCLETDNDDNREDLLPKNNLNILFNFDWGRGSWIVNSQKCAENEVYYPEENNCQELICPPYFTARSGRCIENPHAVYDTESVIPVDSSGVSFYNITLLLSITSMHNEIFNHQMERIFNDLLKSLESNGLKFQSYNSSTNIIIARNHIYLMKVTISLNEIQNSKSSFNYIFNNVLRMENTFQNSNMSARINFENFPEDRLMFCKNPYKLHLSGNKTSFTPIGKTAYLQPAGESFRVKLFMSRFNISFDVHSGSKLEVHSFAFCKAIGISLDCPLLSYRKDNYSIIEGRAYVVGRQQGIDRFEINHGILYVCQVHDVTERDQILEILTFVTLSISILSLLLLLIWHCIFPSFCETLHGKNLVTFSFSLLVAQMLFIVSSLVESIVCKAIAVLQHYFWLTTFFWTCMMAFDLASKFNTKSMLKISNFDIKKRFKQYCLVGWGLPLIIVTICASIEYTDVGIEFRYGEHRPCWIGNAVLSLVVFGTPVAICLLFNTICFMVTLHGIESAKRATKNVRSRAKEKNHCVIYTKISLILGLTWTIGLIGSLTHATAFSYINIVLNGLQGFLLFVTFFSNARVIKKVTKRGQPMFLDSTNKSSKELSVISINKNG